VASRTVLTNKPELFVTFALNDELFFFKQNSQVVFRTFRGLVSVSRRSRVIEIYSSKSADEMRNAGKPCLPDGT